MIKTISATGGKKRVKSAADLDYGVYIVKGDVLVYGEDDLEDFGEVEALISEALRQAKGDVKAATKAPEARYNEHQDGDTKEAYDVLKATSAKFAKGVSIEMSYNTNGSATKAVLLGQWKKLLSVDRPLDFYFGLGKIGGLIGGCKCIHASPDGDFALWKRAADEFIVLITDND